MSDETGIVVPEPGVYLESKWCDAPWVIALVGTPGD